MRPRSEATTSNTSEKNTMRKLFNELIQIVRFLGELLGACFGDDYSTISFENEEAKYTISIMKIEKEKENA